jgi:hypothetical protein
MDVLQILVTYVMAVKATRRLLKETALLSHIALQLLVWLAYWKQHNLWKPQFSTQPPGLIWRCHHQFQNRVKEKVMMGSN